MQEPTAEIQALVKQCVGYFSKLGCKVKQDQPPKMNELAEVRQKFEGADDRVDELVPPEGLHELLARADFVVLAVPLSAQTDGLIGEAELRAMKHGAWLINVSRGRVVREEALLRALREGWIGGACLDVFEEEPLPPESELWSLPNAIVTPHNSGFSPLNFDRASELFLDNLRRYVVGRPLRNRVRLRDL